MSDYSGFNLEELLHRINTGAVIFRCTVSTCLDNYCNFRV